MMSARAAGSIHGAGSPERRDRRPLGRVVTGAVWSGGTVYFEIVLVRGSYWCSVGLHPGLPASDGRSRGPFTPAWIFIKLHRTLYAPPRWTQ